jgi:hypothetical protein
MNHSLKIGHLDTKLVAERGELVIRPLDERIVLRHLTALGKHDGRQWTLGGKGVEFRDGCIIAPWMVGAGVNHVTEEFALRMIRETGCQVIDRTRGMVVEASELEGLAVTSPQP